ncbi:hypothetical protein SGLAM104S_07769 [Streptomyces glaucescens]
MTRLGPRSPRHSAELVVPVPEATAGVVADEPPAAETAFRAAVSRVTLTRVSGTWAVVAVEPSSSSAAVSSPGSASDPEESPASRGTVTLSPVSSTSVVTGTPCEHSSSSGVVAKQAGIRLKESRSSHSAL